MREIEEQILSLAKDLIRYPTLNPPGEEHLIKERVIRSFQELGAKVRIIGEEKRPNILGEIGEGEPVIGILAHMDVVPPGEGWDTDPFIPVVRNGRLYGRGAVDNKGPFAAAWGAVKSLILRNKKIKGKIILGALADEERGSEKGLKLLLKEGFKADLCLIPDGGKINQAIIGEKGLMWLLLKVRGESAHGSEPGRGKNAIWILIETLTRLRKISFPPPSPPFSPLTVNLGQIRGGECPNMVPSHAEATLDIRYPPPLTGEEIIRKLKQNFPPGEEIHLEILNHTSPHIIEPDSKWLKAFLSACRENNLPLKLTTMGGNTVAKLLVERGIPAFCHSPEDEPVTHRANESVSLENLFRVSKIWETFLEKIVC